MRRAWVVPLLIVAMFAACFEPPAEAPADAQVVIGPSGGTLSFGAAALEIPPDALAADHVVRITRVRTPPPGIPGRAVGDVFLFEPEGLQFAKPARLTLALTQAPTGRLFIATAPKSSSTFALLHATHNETSATTALSHFSYFVPVVVADDGGVTTSDAGQHDAGGPPDAGTVEDPGPSLPPSWSGLDGGDCIYADAGAWCVDAVGNSRSCSEIELAGCSYRVTALGVGKTHLAWGNVHSHVFARPKSGGAQVHLADGGGPISTVIIADPFVYFSSLGGITRDTYDGQSDQRHVAPEVANFAVNATDLFWPSGNAIERRTSDQMFSVFVSNEASSPGSLALDSSNLYWAVGSTIRKVPLSGGTPVTLASGSQSARGTIVAGGYVHWMEDGAPAAIRRVPVGGGTPELLVSSATGLRTFTTDGTTLLWATGASSASLELFHKPVVGGTAQRLLTLQLVGALGEFRLGIDDSSYYIVKSPVWRLRR